jgi:hypothetical protein
MYREETTTTTTTTTTSTTTTITTTTENITPRLVDLFQIDYADIGKTYADNGANINGNFLGAFSEDSIDRSDTSDEAEVFVTKARE